MVALAYPNTYHVGMSSLGFQTVYAILNRLPYVACERVFLPSVSLQSSPGELATLESGIPLRDADVLAFSVSFELDYPNVVEMLIRSGIPPLAKDRGDNCPLVVAGGPAMSINPEPLAEFLDAIAVGDGEELVVDMAECLSRTYVSKRELLEALCEIPGMYVPALYTIAYDLDGRVSDIQAVGRAPLPVVRRVTRDLGRHDVSSAVVTPNTELGGMFLVEIARGCARACRFCFAGYGFRPVRYRKASEVHPLVEAEHGQVRETLSAADAVGLVGSSLSDSPWCTEITTRFRHLGFRVNVSSVRAETTDDQLMQALGGVQRTLTLAPEAATERLRRVIRKPMSDEHLFSAVASALQAGVENIKLYFMIGLPTETEEDIEAISDLCRRLAFEFGKDLHSLVVSASPLVPKPFTPFQWHPMDPRKALERKRRAIEHALKDVRCARVSAESARLSEIQALLARGDRRLSRVLLEYFAHKDWGRALRETGTDLEFHLRRERTEHEVFPWYVVDLGLDRRMLWREYQLALRGLLREPRLDSDMQARSGGLSNVSA
ncbi:MAG: radical SAM protein [Armatimonadota bacterium]